MMTDPISDLLTRIRNGVTAKHDVVEVPYSKVKEQIITILQKKGFVSSFDKNLSGSVGRLILTLRYGSKKEPLINSLIRISKPGRRVYVGYKDLKQVLSGLGLAILSTSKGILSDEAARESKVGGELLCSVW